MTKDEFDADIDVGADEGADDFGQAPAPVRKSGGGFLFKFIVILVVMAGGGYFAATQLGVKLPFNIPGLPQQAAAGKTTPAVNTTDKNVAGVVPPVANATDLNTANATDINSGALPPGMPDPAAAPAEDALAALDSPVQPVADQDSMAPQPLPGELQQQDMGVVPPAMPDPALPVDPAANAADLNSTANVTDVPVATATDENFAATATDENLAATATDENSAATPTDLSSVVDATSGVVPPATDELPMPTVDAVDPLAAVTAPETSEQQPVEQTIADIAPPPADETAVAPVPEQPITQMAAPDPAVMGKVSELEQRIASIEEMLTELKATQISKADISALRDGIEELKNAPQAQPRRSEAVDSAQREVSSYSPRKAKAKTTTAKAKTKSLTAARSVATQWVLKSAKPGTAWVAARGSSELKTVSVGDTLKGVGRITAIMKDSGGRWVVNGTGGRINQ